jgi:hypothetical protein
VYVGILIGLGAAAVLRRGRASVPPAWLFALQIATIVLMAATGFPGLYGWIALSSWAKFAVGALFGQTLGSMSGEVIKGWSGSASARAWRRSESAAYVALGLALVGLPAALRLSAWGPGVVTVGSIAGVAVALAAFNTVAMLALVRPKSRAGAWSPLRVAAIVVACGVELLLLRAWRVFWTG